MKIDKWLEVNLVGLVILGGLMFVVTRVMSLATTLANVQTNLAATADRVEHVAQAIPGLATRVMANEQVTRPLRTLVIVGRPERIEGKWRAAVSVIDTQSVQRWIAEVPLASATDRAVLSELAWAGYELDPQFVSFTRVLNYAHTVSLDSDSTLPPQIDPSVSFALSSSSPKELLAVANHLGIDAKPASFDLKISDWNDFAQALRAHPSEFLSVSPASMPRARD